MRQELVAQGFSWEYLDEWQPKTTLYRHAPGLDTKGDMVFPVGTEIKGVPGNPDYVLRKARLGMYPYPPNSTCPCRWCAERALAHQKAQDVPEQYRCDEEGCDFFGISDSHAGKLSSLRMHKRSAH